jgi:hypothetical protein
MKTDSPRRHIVADPAFSHGKPTFRGTRILVADVLKQVASGNYCGVGGSTFIKSDMNSVARA